MGRPHFGQRRGMSLWLVVPAPAVKMGEMPGLRREKVMIAGTETGRAPMRGSKAVALMDGGDLSAFMVLDELGGGAPPGGRAGAAVPTRQVVAGFGPISMDNRRVIVQEWLAEAFTMWGIAAIVIAATAAGGAMTDVRAWVYRVAAALLVALGALTAVPGARAAVVWFKVCPLVMVVAAVLL